MHIPIPTKLEQLFTFRLNYNQSQEITRLFHEISCRNGVSPRDIIQLLGQRLRTQTTGNNTFPALKQELIRLRFPVTSAQQNIPAAQVFLPPLRKPLWGRIRPPVPFVPQRIFFDAASRDSALARRFHELFPQTHQEEIASLKSYLQRRPFKLSQLKAPAVFLLREHWDFIKPCPCTPGHLRCNYWIFNLGFGCPYDCAYCFLQQYTNTPGILLPSNLDDFFDRFAAFMKTFSRPLRIGTGEFCDSLALDHITGYSSQLVNFFRDKPVLFELKTKSDTIDRLLACAPSENIVISWSLNPQPIIDREEFGAASLSARLRAAAAAQQHGYGIAFHFDPIVFSPGWETAYAEVVRQLYEKVKAPLCWISLGTLRGTRLLKTIAEQRFPRSHLWQGELLLGKDKKLRYPACIRKEIYQRMAALIRTYDTQTPLYLCMEDDECWRVLYPRGITSAAMEKILLGKR